MCPTVNAAGGHFCRPTAVVTGSAAKGAETATEFGIDHVLDYDGFLAGDAIDAYDAAYIATPNATHPKFVEGAAEHGIHVLCEKPLAATREGANRAIEACGDAGVTLMVAYRLQAEPTVRRTREVFRDGVNGFPVVGFIPPLKAWAFATLPLSSAFERIRRQFVHPRSMPRSYSHIRICPYNERCPLPSERRTHSASIDSDPPSSVDTLVWSSSVMHERSVERSTA